MEDVIKSIIKIEEEAARLEKEIEEKIRQKKLDQEKNLENLHKNLKEKAKSKVDTLRAWEMRSTQEEVERYQALAQKQMNHLKQMEEENMDQWVRSLFVEITKE